MNNRRHTKPVGAGSKLFGRAFDKYQRKKVPKKYRLPHQSAGCAILNHFFKVTQRAILESEGGVIWDGLGYFSHWRIPEKRIMRGFSTNKDSKKTYGLHLNSFSDQYFYNTSFFLAATRRNQYLSGWTMDRLFNREIKRGRLKMLKKGMRYKSYSTFVLSSFNRALARENSHKI